MVVKTQLLAVDPTLSRNCQMSGMDNNKNPPGYHTRRQELNILQWIDPTRAFLLRSELPFTVVGNGSVACAFEWTETVALKDTTERNRSNSFIMSGNT